MGKLGVCGFPFRSAPIEEATPVTAQTIAITGGTVFPVSGPKIDRGTVLIVNGKIIGVQG